MATAKQLREKLAAKQTALGEVFEQAKTDDGQIDFDQVKCLGDQVKGSVAVADAVRQLNAELEEIAEQAETIEAGEKASADHAARETAMKRPPHAAPSAQAEQAKSLRQQISESKDFREWCERGSRDGITMKFPELYPSDVLAGAGVAKTMGQQKTLMQTSAGWDPESIRLPGFVEDAARPIQLLDVIPMARTGSDTITYMEETTRTHSAAEMAEGGTYAESTFAFTEQTSPVRKIGDSLPVTDEQLEDVTQVESYINNRLLFGVRQRLDSEVLVGDGVAPNLEGIANVAGIQTQAKGADPVPDAFHKLMTSIRLTGRAVPTHCVMHPTDWQTVRLLRTTDGIYIWGSPAEAGNERLWGLPVVQSDAGSAGTGYVGSFQPAWISLFERRGVDLQVGYTGTQFVEGKRTIRADMRTALVVFRPAAFGTVTGI